MIFNGQFNISELPSAGELTVEADREVIRMIENEVHSTYAEFVILAESQRFQAAMSESKHSFNLYGKQIRDEDIELLIAVLTSGDVAAVLDRLNLRENRLCSRGTVQLMREIVCSRSCSSLKELDLSDNPVGAEGIRIIAELLPQARR